MNLKKISLFLFFSFLVLVCALIVFLFYQSAKGVKIGPVNKTGIHNGVFEGSYLKFPNFVVADVKIEKSRIVNVEIKFHFQGRGRKAETPIINRIIKRQATEVDAVTGATNSSYAIMYAVQDALNKSEKY